MTQPSASPSTRACSQVCSSLHSAVSSTLLSRLHCTDTGAVRQMPSRSWPRPRPCSSCGCPRAATTHWTRRRANEQSRMQRFWRLWVDLFAKARNLALGALRQAARFRFLLEASVRQSSAENESHQPLFLSHLRCASPLPHRTSCLFLPQAAPTASFRTTHGPTTPARRVRVHWGWAWALHLDRAALLVDETRRSPRSLAVSPQAACSP